MFDEGMLKGEGEGDGGAPKSDAVTTTQPMDYGIVPLLYEGIQQEQADTRRLTSYTHITRTHTHTHKHTHTHTHTRMRTRTHT
jgi:hypothetical protein